MREQLKQGATLIGGWIQIPHVAVARLLASSGFDWVAVDTEHGVIDLESAASLFAAIKEQGSVPLVRVPGVDYAQTKRYLDAGAEGIIAPLVNCREDAETLVRAVKYPPEGERGVGYCAANLYGFALDAYLKRANADILCCVQIEHVKAIEQIDAILSVPGVDAAFIGPYDLTASLGITAQFDHPKYRAALDTFLAACARHKVAPGIHVVQPDPEAVARAAKQGYRLIAYSLDVTMLGHAFRTDIARIRELI